MENIREKVCCPQKIMWSPMPMGKMSTFAKFSATNRTSKRFISTMTFRLSVLSVSWIPWNLSFRYILSQKKKTPNNAVTPQYSFYSMCWPWLAKWEWAISCLVMLRHLLASDVTASCSGGTRIFKLGGGVTARPGYI